MIQSDKTFVLNIASPERAIYAGEARMVSVLSVSGELGILPRHSPLLADLLCRVRYEVRVTKTDGRAARNSSTSPAATSKCCRTS